jgi:hypothetical protein
LVGALLDVTTTYVSLALEERTRSGGLFRLLRQGRLRRVCLVTSRFTAAEGDNSLANSS